METKEEKGLVQVSKNNGALVSSNPAEMVTMLLEKNIDIDKIEKMIDLQAKYDKIEAEKAYTQAMAQFKKNPPEIDKDKNVSYKNKKGFTVKYNHATLGNVTRIINTELAKYGFSAGWKKRHVLSALDNKFVTFFR